MITNMQLSFDNYADFGPGPSRNSALKKMEISYLYREPK